MPAVISLKWVIQMLFCFLIYGQGALAARTQIPFYKSAQSRFPSGYASIENLVKNKIDSITTAQKGYMANGEFYAPEDITALTALHLSHYVINLKTDERLKVQQVKPTGLEVLSTTKKRKDFMRFNEVRTDHFDLGTVVTLKDTYLRSSASEKASVQTTVPRGFRLTPLQFSNQHVQVKYRDYVGYLNLTDVLTKFDFATMALVSGEWLMIDKREGGQILSHLKKMIDLSQVKALITPETKGIVSSTDQAVPYMTRVEMVTLNEPIWLQSQLSGHGLVWWKKSAADKIRSTEEEIVLVDQLLKKPISSVSFDPKNPLKGILSSNGVYITQDGLHWRRVRQFADFNGPVHYFNDSLIFAGHFRSLDKGRTFENYIQVEKISEVIEKKFGQLPKTLLVEKIETRPPFKLRVLIDAGFKKLELESPLFTQNWKVL